MKKRFIIGDVADFFEISKQTLIYYDKEDILKPSFVGDNGYRYYTFEDLDRLELILSLKESGLKLSEIRNYIQNPSSESCIMLLSRQKEKLKLKINSLQKTLSVLEKRTQNIIDYNNYEAFDGIRITKKPERYIYNIFAFDSHDGNEFPLAIKIFKDLSLIEPLLSGITTSKLITTIHKSELLDGNSNALNLLCAFVEQKNHDNVIVIPAGYYICYQHKGHYEFFEKAYDHIFKYIKDKSLNITGDSIEIPLVDIWTTKTPDHFVSEVQIPISPININQEDIYE